MIVFPKVSIHPIILPCNVFYATNGVYRNLVEMNPSFYINDDEYTILVRCVNYAKYTDGLSVIYENEEHSPKESNSTYYKLTGKIETDFSLDNSTLEKMNYTYNLPTHWSYWRGLEDIRFVNKDTILVTVPELNPTGEPRICQASLQENTVSSFELCSPNAKEKNWMPYYHNESNKVIYSVHPFQTKSILNSDIEDIALSEELQTKLNGYHGSTNGIDFLGEKLFLIHKNEDNRVIHRWLLFHPDTHSVKVSEPFVFFNHSYIEFNCSLAKHNGSIYTSLGVNDDKAFILQLSEKDIAQMLD